MRIRIRTIWFATLALLAIFSISLIAPANTTAQTPDPVWEGQYYDNGFLGGSPVFTRTDTDIAFDWGLGSPGNGIPENEFSVRWSTDIFLNAGTYRFWALMDDNVSITVEFRNTIINTFESNQVDELVSADIELDSGSYHIQVDYREVNDVAFAYMDFANLANNPTGPDFPVPSNPAPNGAWTAQYYDNAGLAGTPIVVRGEMQPGANWGSGSPLPAIPVDNWSARWNSTLTLEGGNYQIRVLADDGVRVYIDGLLVINEWHLATGEPYVVTRNLTSGNHTVSIDFYEAGGLAALDFSIVPIDSPSNGTILATITAGRLNVRDAPSAVTGDILTRVSNGETYVALARTADSTWAKLNVDGVIGWVNTTYVFLPAVQSLPVESVTNPTGYTVRATPYTVNIRTGPGTQFQDIGNLRAGFTAEVIGRNTNATWWQVSFNDIVGWVSARYAIIESGADLSDIPITQ